MELTATPTSPETPGPLNGLLVIVRSPVREIERRAAINRTWRKDLETLGATFLWSIHEDHRTADGTYHLTVPAATLEGDTLWIPGADSHGNLTSRMVHTFRWLAQGIGKDLPWTHTLHMDDDCYVVVPRLADLFANSCVGDVLGHKNDGWYFAGGPGVLLSRDAVRVLDYYLCRDDCAIGALLSVVGPAQGLVMEHNPNFRPWREVGWPTQENATVIQHYVRSAQEIDTLHKETRTWPLPASLSASAT